MKNFIDLAVLHNSTFLAVKSKDKKLMQAESHHTPTALSLRVKLFYTFIKINV